MKKYSYMRVAMLFSMAIGICSCEGSDLPFGAITNKAIIPVVLGESMTKANDEVALASLKENGFKMDIVAETAYNDGKAGLYGGTRTVTWDGAWSIAEPACWINNTQMSFWAYNMAAFDNCDITKPDAGDPEISFCYPGSGATADPYAQTDLLFAKTKKSHGDSSEHVAEADDDKVELRFYHALSKIAFDSEVTGIPAGYSISAIRLNDLKTSGSAVFDGTVYTWDQVHLTGNSSFSTVNSSQDDILKEYFLVIPQDAGGQGATMEIMLTHDSEPTIHLSSLMKKNYQMKAGYVYTYKISIDNTRNLELTLSVSPWDRDVRDLEIKDQSVHTMLTYNNVNSIVNDSEKTVTIKELRPVEGKFRLDSPKGAKVLLALDGNLNAFEVKTNEGSNTAIIRADQDITFSIKPLVLDPKIDYKTQLHVYLIHPDASVSELDEALMGKTGEVINNYTIILPRQ